MGNPWIHKVCSFIPQFLSGHPVLGTLSERVTGILHGSTAWGFDDVISDIDLWLLLSSDDLAATEAAAGTRFFEFELDGKKGHLNATNVEEFSERLERCDMDTLYQLRRAIPIVDPDGKASKLIERSRLGMRDDVRYAWFFYHYVEMRGEHRSVDSPLERGQPVAALLAVGKTLAHALRAAIVLDRQPYPYDKWLLDAARETPAGRRLAPHVETLLDQIASDKLRFRGPQATHPINQSLYAIRRELIDAARQAGIDEAWLGKWWLHMTQAHEAVKNAKW